MGVWRYVKGQYVNTTTQESYTSKKKVESLYPDALILTKAYPYFTTLTKEDDMFILSKSDGETEVDRITIDRKGMFFLESKDQILRNAGASVKNRVKYENVCKDFIEETFFKGHSRKAIDLLCEQFAKQGYPFSPEDKEPYKAIFDVVDFQRSKTECLDELDESTIAFTFKINDNMILKITKGHKDLLYTRKLDGLFYKVHTRTQGILKMPVNLEDFKKEIKNTPYRYYEPSGMSTLNEWINYITEPRPDLIEQGYKGYKGDLFDREYMKNNSKSNIMFEDVFGTTILPDKDTLYSSLDISSEQYRYAMDLLEKGCHDFYPIRKLLQRCYPDKSFSSLGMQYIMKVKGILDQADACMISSFKETLINILQVVEDKNDLDKILSFCNDYFNDFMTRFGGSMYLTKSSLKSTIANNFREYCDYVKMYMDLKILGNLLDLNIKCKHGEPYENAIHRMHDKAVDYHWRYSEDLDEIKVSRAYEMNKRLRYFDNIYEMIVPQKASEFKAEGINQHNCVQSYTHEYAEGRTTVVFMRERKKPEQSFITIEVRKNKLEQAMFKYNKPVTREHRAEFNFIKQWCSQKGIIMRDM